MSVPVLSFFTGGGFLDLGFEQAGFEIVWTNEIDPSFARMYSHGVSAWRASRCGAQEKATISNRKSIADLRPEEILLEGFGNATPEMFGIIGGPPCTDFSVGGKNRGSEGRFGSLTQVFVDLICEIKPDFFVIENVPGLIRTRKHRNFLASIVDNLEHPRNGYLVSKRILSSLEFGVPQDRDRLFLIGISAPLAERILGALPLPGDESWCPWPTPTYANAKNLPWPVNSPFGGRPPLPDGIPLELTVYPLLQSSPPPSSLGNGLEAFIPYSPKFWRIAEGDDSRKSFKRLHRYRYSPTSWYGNNEVHLHPWLPRRLSVRESLRIQTVPDTYVLPEDVSLSSKFKMICNGVPCKLARVAAESILGLLGEESSLRQVESPLNSSAIG